MHSYCLFEQSIEIPSVSTVHGDLGLVSRTLDYSTCRVSGREGQCFGRLGIPSSQQQRLASLFKVVNHLLHPFTIDLLASRMNSQLPEYCSWRPDLQARVRWFFNFWSQYQLYLFPPFNLIGRALSKMCLEEVDCACLIAPTWPAQAWYSQLLRMLARNSYPTPHGAGSPLESRPEASTSYPGETNVFSQMACLTQA